jgi:hypothetical protein
MGGHGTNLGGDCAMFRLGISALTLTSAQVPSMGSGGDMYQLLVLFARHRPDKTLSVQIAFRQTILPTTSRVQHMPWMLAACVD